MTFDLRHMSGPFDIVGDVHGCADELLALLARLGYEVAVEGTGERRGARIAAPHGRHLVFVGDFVDRGPASPDVLRIAMAADAAGLGYAVIGNHDDKFRRWLKGSAVKISHGLEQTVAQMAGEPASFHAGVRAYLERLPYYLWLDGGALAVAHAGFRQEMLGRTSGAARAFAVYGDTDGKRDESGLTIRYDWASAHTGQTRIVYGHTPIEQAEWRFNTLCLDTGCCFGGALTALRWPENEIVYVPARRTYAVRGRPFGHPPPREAAPAPA